MTVHRERVEIFDMPPAEVALAVRSVLSRCPPYVRMTETLKATTFKTNVKPKWWLLGTDMTVELHLITTGTKVVAATKSQSFITGDVFQFYDGYLSDFLREVRLGLQRQKTEEVIGGVN